jgi:cytochrome oxidase Cu insertion factor (SCO1/SenC/PrrC family)
VGAAALVAVGVVVLHGGTSATAAGSAVVSSGHATTSTPGAPEAVAAGGGYRLASVTGEPVTFPDGRPTLLYFMSASCSSCWQGNSQIAQIYSALRTRAQVVSLDVTPQVDTVSQVQEMAQQTGATWPQAFATSAILNRYHVDYLDTVVVLSPTGKVVYDGGIPSNAKLLALVKGAAGSSAST